MLQVTLNFLFFLETKVKNFTLPISIQRHTISVIPYFYQYPTLRHTLVKPTLQIIAERTGVSKMTVSRILRNYPNHNPKTREKVLKAAEEIGYKKNPLIAALMTQVRSRKATPFRPAIALIQCTEEGQEMHKQWQHLRLGVLDEAQFHGFEVETFNINQFVTPERMIRVLEARGFHCVIFEPFLASEMDLDVNLDKFAGISTTSSVTHPMDHVAADQHAAMTLAIQNLKSKGYRRYGFVADRYSETLMQNRRLGAYILSQMTLKKDEKIPVFFQIAEGEAFALQLKSWLEKYRPEVVISTRREMLDALELLDLKVPGDLAYVCLNLDESSEDIAGINPNWYTVGAIAAKQVMELLIGNYLGAPAHPKITLIQPTWNDGNTLPLKFTPSYDVA